MKKKIVIAMLCITMSAAMITGCQSNSTASNASSSSEESAESQYDYTGQVSKVDGNTITLALGEEKAMEKPEGADGEAPSGEAPTDGTAPSDEAPTDGTAPSGEAPADGAAPNGGGQGGPGSLELTGEEQTITVDGNTTYQIEEMGQQSEGSLSDITEGVTLRVTMNGETAGTIIIIKQGGPGGGGEAPGASAEQVSLTGSKTIDGATENLDSETLDSSTADESVILVNNGGTLTLTGGTLTKTGDTTSDDNSNFYGQNAALTVCEGSRATVSGTTINTDADGSNAVFATGEGADITADNITIHTTMDSSRGLDATYGGTVTASNVDITTEGAHCAPIATDRGGGTVNVTTGTLSSAGDGSPCIYSTGDITATDVTGTATGAQTLCVEGKNSVTLNNCTLTGAGENGLMLYQSTSGDAEEGTAQLTTSDSSLTTTSEGAMFYITNTTAEATLQNTTLSFSSGTLVESAGNSTNNWGTPGSNGGAFTLTGINQIFEGDIICDEISTTDLVLTEASSFTGAINQDQNAKEASISLDESSTWNLTNDSYLSSITNADTACSNIKSNGHTIYYDSANEANAWLDGQTITLSDGGSITPQQ